MRSRRWLALVFVCAVAAGCQDDVTGNAVQVGGAAPDFGMDPANTRGVPQGTSSIESYEVIHSNTLGPDAFGRSGYTGLAVGYGACTPGLGGICYNFGSDKKRIANAPRAIDTTWVRDSIGDPRLPAMKQQSLILGWANIAGPECTCLTSAGTGVFPWEIYVRITMAPSKQYSLLFVKYGLQVRGKLDAVERLQTGIVTQPDSLILLDPNPGGFPTVNYTWVSNAACGSIPVPAGANPLHLGSRNTAGSGLVTFDQCFGSNNLYYHTKTGTLVDSNPLFPNSLDAPRTQEYNYWEIREGTRVAGVDTGKVVARIQVGADIDPVTRAAIPNAFGPFPARAYSPGALIITYGVATGGVNGARLGAINLEALESGKSYKVVGFHRATGVVTPLTAKYWTVRTDTTGRNDVGAVITTTTISDTTIVTEITGGGTNVRHWVQPTDALNPSNKLVNFTDIGLQPNSATTGIPIWARLTSLAAGSATILAKFHDVDTVKFGKLPIIANPVEYIFRPAGSASGTNRGTELGVEFRHLSRPAIGYYYAAWLVTANGSKPPVLLGELKGPLPNLTSLRDADIAGQLGGVLTDREILSANVLIRPGDLAALGIKLNDYDTIRLTLEAKDGVPAIAPIVILEGNFPSAGAP